MNDDIDNAPTVMTDFFEIVDGETKEVVLRQRGNINRNEEDNANKSKD